VNDSTQANPPGLVAQPACLQATDRPLFADSIRLCRVIRTVRPVRQRSGLCGTHDRQRSQEDGENGEGKLSHLLNHAIDQRTETPSLLRVELWDGPGSRGLAVRWSTDWLADAG